MPTKKKALLVLSGAFALVFVSFAFSASVQAQTAETPPCGNYGDINGDGFVTKEDANGILGYIVENNIFSQEQIKRSDVNNDGAVTTADSTLVLRYVDGLIDTFSVCVSPALTVKLKPAPSATLTVNTSQAVVARVVLTAGSASDINVTAIRFAADDVAGLNTASGASNELGSLRLFDGSMQVGSTRAVFTNASPDTVTFSNLNIFIPKGGSKTLDLKANILTVGDGILFVGIADLTDISDVVATRLSSNTTVYGAGTDADNSGKITFLSAGALKISVASDTPTSQYIPVGTAGKIGVDFASFKFTASKESIEIKALKVTLAQDNNTGFDKNDVPNFSALHLYKGATKVGTTVYVVGSNDSAPVDITFYLPSDGLIIPKNSSIVLTLKADMSGTLNGAESMTTPNFYIADVVGSSDLTESNVKATGVESGSRVNVSAGSPDPSALTGTEPSNINAMTIVRSEPIFKLCTPSNCSKASPSGIVVPGLTEVLRFRIEADGDDVIFGANNNIRFRIKQSGGSDAGRSATLYEYGRTIPLQTLSNINLTTAGAINFKSFSTIIPKGAYKEYYVKVDLTDYVTTGDAFRLSIGDTVADLSWSDGETSDIATSFLTVGLPMKGISLGGSGAVKSITVTSPNGGETWGVDETREITWVAKGIDNVLIDLLDQDGDIYAQVASYGITASKGRDSWKISNRVRLASQSYYLRAGDKFKISVVELKDDGTYTGARGISDKSDNFFTILANPPCSNYGDVTDDGFVTKDDANGILGYIAGNNIFSQEQIKRADVNNDGAVTTADSTLVLRYVDGLIDTFAVCDQSSITVLSPNGGEEWTKGTTQDITWDSTGTEKVYIDITTYGVTPAKAYALTNGGTLASAKKYSWDVGSKWPNLPVGKYKIRILTYPLPASGEWKEGTNYDKSDNYFSIVAAPPTGKIPPCSNYGDVTGDGFVTKDDANGILGYIVGNNIFSQEQIKRADVNNDGAVTTADSTLVLRYVDGLIDTFAVCDVSITVLSPNGGEEWISGQTHRIKWEASGVDSVQIYIFDDSILGSGSTNYVVPNNGTIQANLGYYDWVIPDIERLPGDGGNNYKIRVQDSADGSIIDKSNSYFSIVASSPPTDLPDLEITALTWRPQFPKGGETISFAATVKNNSEVDINQPFKVNVGGTSTIIPSLAANETASAQATFGLTKVGPNKVHASVDYESVIKESNEANNDYMATVKIAPTYSGEGAFKLAHWETLQLANGIIMRAIVANVSGQEPYKVMFQIYSSDYDLITTTGKLLAGDVWSFGAGNGAISGDINIEVNSFDVRAPGNANWSVSINASSVDVEKLNVDLKINGSATPSPVAYNSTFLASWSSKGATSCSAFAHVAPSVGGEIWTNFKDLPTSGDIDMYARHETFGYLSRLRLGMQCFDSFGRSVSDEVTLPVLAPEATPELTDAPEMVYPKDRGIRYLEGSYMFKVKPIEGATGYLFRLYQGGNLIYDNERDDGKLSPDGEFAIHPDHLSHSKFKEGDVEVSVKAKVNGKWSKESIIIITLKPGEVDRSVRQCLAEGTLVKTPDDPKIYVIKDCKKKWIKTGEEFEEGGHKWENVREAADPVVEAYANYLIAQANLLRAINQEKIYRVISGKKLWVPTAKAFNAQKLSWEDVQETSEADVSAYPTARLIRAKNDPKVYFITDNGFKKWIRTAAIFNSYGDNKWEDIVEVDQEVAESFEGVELIRLVGGTKVYKIEAGVKRWVKTESAFVRNNLDWKRIVSINQTELNYYQEGAVIE